MINRRLHPNIQLFAGSDDDTPPGDTNTEVNYDDLLNTDPKFAAWAQKRERAASEKAKGEAELKWKNIHDETISEAERLKNMTAEEKATYFQQKYEASVAAQTRKDNARNLQETTRNLFTQEKIPVELIPLFDYETATAESIDSQIKLLANYEFFPKGTFETKVQEAVNKKLQQNSPHYSADVSGDIKARAQKALESGDRIGYIKLMQEAITK